MMLNTKWQARFYRLAQLVGSWSKDPSTRNGAVIVDAERRVVSLGYNGFPRGVGDDAQRYDDRKEKYGLIVHAEANAILNARLPLQGTALIATMFPCSNCTKMIVQSGVAAVYAPAPRSPTHPDDTWAVDARHSKLMLEEAGIEVTSGW